MYTAWITDPKSVHPSWQQYFANYQKTFNKQYSEQELEQYDRLKEQTEYFLKTYLIAQRFKQKGHLQAQLDPLNLESKYGKFHEFGKHQIKQKIEDGLNLSDKELDTPFSFEQGEYLDDVLYFLKEKQTWTLREIIKNCLKIFSGKVAYEFIHIDNKEQQRWLLKKVEKLGLKNIKKEKKLKTLYSLSKNEAFNIFLKNKFNTSKRFGVEGCDSMISGLDCLVEIAVDYGIENIIMGMPHRGRLNVLSCVLGKPNEQIFAEFQDITQKNQNDTVFGHAGDVKYHLGVSQDRDYPNQKKINLRILANPSHLEAVNPCVYGTTRAIQDFKNDSSGDTTMGVLIHGDSAFNGQGVVYESFQMAGLKDYTSRGIVHIIVNNQIGFTTTPQEFRSGFQSTDIAKVVDCPIFHVNADEPDLVDEVIKIAFEYRQTFKKDVIVDIIGYRRYGHNELDQPMYTQPIMYKTISTHPPVVEIYKKKLIEEGLITEEDYQQKMQELLEQLEASYQISKKETFNPSDWKAKSWEQVRKPHKFGIMKNTSLSLNELKRLGQAITSYPDDFNIHPLLKRIIQTRRDSIEQNSRIDMGTSEALAWASLLNEGFGIRVSGQDVQRGTFSQRHSVFVDQKIDRKHVSFYNLLNEEEMKSKKFSANNSHLSEYGVLGFEYGYSIANPNVLVIWEAQFGDFANGAQIMIDNFIASGETKWGVQSGIVLLLPHGMDGQGAEHSSARLERFLQLSDDQPEKLEQGKLQRQIRNCNWQVIVCSNSVNYFHALRRQLRRDFRKPLIVMESKKLLRFKQASSYLKEFESQRNFMVCYPDNSIQISPNDIKRVILCSGQVYYDIAERRDILNKKDIAIIRIEELSPFPYDFLQEILSQYSNADFVWCQEEHKNQGAWGYTRPRINKVLQELYQDEYIKEEKEVQYIGRKVSAATAVGSSKVHKQELEVYLKQIFNY